MGKSDYLNNGDVKKFIAWLRTRLESRDLAHSYHDRQRQTEWRCSSLFDAFAQYAWPNSRGSNFKANASELEMLRKRLEDALRHNDDEEACEAAVDVMKWGGVAAGNVRWLRSNRQGLAQVLKNIKDALSSGEDADPRLTNPGLRFNAGMTKVYSLLCDSFIIYDSRVAAALGLAVAKYGLQHKLSSVPALLQFPWSPAKEAPGQQNPKRRNPSQGTFGFRKLQAGPMHACWNLRATWLLEAVLKDLDSNFNKQEGISPLRALEAALFMIGYDLPNSVFASPERVAPEEGDDAWNQCFTHGKCIEFNYRLDNQGICARNDEDATRVVTFAYQELDQVLLALWANFGDGPFPLSNSATAVRSGDASPGLGTTYFELTHKNPPDTSKLAAILEDLCIFIPVDAAQNRGRNWVLNVDALGRNNDSIVVDIRSYLERIEPDLNPETLPMTASPSSKLVAI